MTPWLPFSLIAALVLGGCTVQEEQADPGARGPLLFRLWDAETRAANLPPTEIRADVMHQDGTLTRIELEPVLIRRPMAEGEVWLHAPRGTMVSTAGRAIDLSGPVSITGMLAGEPVTGCADAARVPPGSQVLELDGLRLLRGSTLVTTPRASLSRQRITGQGPVRVVPLAAPLAAAMASVPRR